MNVLDKKKEIKSMDMKKLAEYRKYLRKHPDLRFLFFELTDSCNLRCRHCGSNCEPKNARYADTDMILDLIRQLKVDFKDREPRICLTGGEPLLHPDFEKITNAINEAGIP